MATNNNFMWMEEDIRDTLVLKVIRQVDDKQELYGVFEVLDVLETTGDQLDIETANIDDLTKMITMGMVRFVNVLDSSDIIDIPLRNIYILYEKGNKLGEIGECNEITFDEVDAFSIIDGTVINDLLILSAMIGDCSEDLFKVMNISSKFGSYGMQEKFDALSEITLINHRRLISDLKERKLV